MRYECIANKFQQYLSKINKISEDKCCICNRTSEELKKNFYEYAKNNVGVVTESDLDEIFLLSYKTNRPVCFACYYGIKQNPELIRGILEKHENEIWD